MNKPFWDNHQFLHDKADADSNNPLIYSAYWRCLTGEKIGYDDVFYTDMLDHSVMGNDISITRSPSNKSPTSLDEIIGATYLDLLDDEFLKLYDYRWHDTLYSPSKTRVLQALIYVAGKHRNFFKDNQVRDLHPIAYWIPFHIQYWLKKKADKRSLHLAPFFYLWLISVFMKRNYKNGEKQTGAISQKNIAFLVLSDLGSLYWIKLFNHKKNLNDYFGDKNHPIVRYLSNK